MLKDKQLKKEDKIIMTKEIVNLLQITFDTFDTDRSGSIDFKEFR